MDMRIKELNSHYFEAVRIEDLAERNKAMDAVLEKLKLYLEECRQQDFSNVNIILRLAIVLYLLREEDRAVELLDTISSEHCLYSTSLLIRTYIHTAWTPINQRDFDILLKTAQNEKDSEMKSMMLTTLCRYGDVPTQEAIRLLRYSIQLCSTYVYNYTTLAYCFGMGLESTTLVIKGMRNIVEVSLRHSDITDPNEFINKKIKGIHLHDFAFKQLLDRIDPFYTY